MGNHLLCNDWVYGGSGDVSVQWDARFSGYKLKLDNTKLTAANGSYIRCWNRITVFTNGGRKNAIDLAVAEASKYGYIDVTIDHIARIG